MFFSHAQVYQFTRPPELNGLEASLKEFSIKPLGAQDVSKRGWVSALPGAELMAHTVDKCILFAMKEEHKLLPPKTIKKQLNARVDAIELEQGRKLKKKEKDALLEDIVQQLLPRAFTDDSITYGYISLKHNLLVVNVCSSRKAEEFISLLRKTLGSLPVVPVQPKNQLDVLMTDWLVKKEHPAPFEITNNAILVSALEGGGTARLKNEDLFSDEVQGHVNSDKLVTEIGLKTDDVWFTLTNALQIKGIKFTDVLQEQNGNIDKDDFAARFDADFTLMTGTLDIVISHLFDVLSVVKMEDM